MKTKFFNDGQNLIVTYLPQIYDLTVALRWLFFIVCFSTCVEFFFTQVELPNTTTLYISA